MIVSTIKPSTRCFGGAFPACAAASPVAGRWAAALAVAVLLLTVASANAQTTRVRRAPKLMDLRFSASSDQGTFLVLPTTIDSPSGRPGAHAALWQGAIDLRVYLFDRLLFTPIDRAHALLNVQRDFRIPLSFLGADLEFLSDEVAAALTQREDITTWVPLCGETIERITGLTRANIANIAPGETGTVAGGRNNGECSPPSAAVFDPFLDVACDADAGPLAIHFENPCDDNDDCTADCCIDGECVNTPDCGGGPPPPDCQNDPDPCCGDPCCGDPCCQDPCSCDPCCPVTDPCDPDCGDPCAPECIDCDDGDECTDDTCSGGTCSNTDVADPCCGVTNPCDPECGDPCLCLDCNDGNPCTDDSCSGGSCSNTDVADPCCGVTDPCDPECGDPCAPECIDCDDGLFCNGVEPCSNGACQPGTAPCSAPQVCCEALELCGDCCNDADCNDGNECTNDTCNAGSCSNTPLTGSTCTDDGNECTDDLCQADGTCGHPPKTDGSVCTDDGNACTDDVCTADAGGNMICDHPNKPDCTACQGGKCVSGACSPDGACCSPSGSCSVTAQQCCIDQGGTYLGAGTVCLPSDLCMPACENCHAVSMTFYECGHFTPNPSEPCAQDTCIRDVLLTASCDNFPNRVGPAKCNTFDTGVAGEVVQTLYSLSIPEICSTSNPGGFHLWTKTYSGCGTTCTGQPWLVRCDTGPCGGQAIDTSERGIMHDCTGCP